MQPISDPEIESELPQLRLELALTENHTTAASDLGLASERADEHGKRLLGVQSTHAKNVGSCCERTDRRVTVRRRRAQTAAASPVMPAPRERCKGWASDATARWYSGRRSRVRPVASGGGASAATSARAATRSTSPSGHGGWTPCSSPPCRTAGRLASAPARDRRREPRRWTRWGSSPGCSCTSLTRATYHPVPRLVREPPVMRIVALITQASVSDRILTRGRARASRAAPGSARSPPSTRRPSGGAHEDVDHAIYSGDSEGNSYSELWGMIEDDLRIAIGAHSPAAETTAR